MKKSILYVLMGLMFAACEKEDALQPRVDFSNVYEITNDPTDSIQAKRYQLYTDYNVSVYFTDTVGQFLFSYDINGDPVYEYELLDLTWEFSSSSAEDVDLEYHFLTTDEDKMKALKFVEYFCQNCAQSLRPLTMLVTDYMMVTAGTAATPTRTTEMHNFRTMVWGDVIDLTDEEREELLESTCKDLVGEKIQNYTDVVYQFQLVSDDYYDKRWTQTLPETQFCVTERVDENNPYAYMSSWFTQNYITLVLMQGYSHEDAVAALNDRRTAYLNIVAAWGFLYSYSSSTAPSYTDDLECYVEQLLSDDATEWFEKYYSNYPLVMKKYQLLRDLIENEMGVKIN